MRPRREQVTTPAELQELVELGARLSMLAARELDNADRAPSADTPALPSNVISLDERRRARAGRRR